jgi:hypothetical protein
MAPIIEIWSAALTFEEGHPLGGTRESNLSDSIGEPLEANGISMPLSGSDRRLEIISIDALYPGELASLTAQQPSHRIVAASHTHTAPMLNRDKPRLGRFAETAFTQWLRAINNAERQQVEVDFCRVFTSEIPVPVYRRFDRPDSVVNRALARWARAYPNEFQPIDRNLYLYVLEARSIPKVVLVHHACHPVSRSRSATPSADYVAAIRKEVRARFGPVPCLFFQGASGDVRPNQVAKRVKVLPRSRLNWRFNYQPSIEEERRVDRSYRDGVRQALPLIEFPLSSASAFRVSRVPIALRHYHDVCIDRLTVGECIKFDFVPFEVSHHFQIEAHHSDPWLFIVGCAKECLGYLPHPSQIRAAGYEVDASRPLMGLPHRVELSGISPWRRYPTTASSSK